MSTKVDTLGEEGVCDVENSASHTGRALLVYYCVIFGSHVSPLYCLSVSCFCSTLHITSFLRMLT